MTKFEHIKHLEERYETLDSDLDHMCWRSEVGLEVDMDKWYLTIGKMEHLQEEIARLQYHAPTLDDMNKAIARADVILDELHDLREQSDPDVEPFSPDDTQPEPEEPEYDEYIEWVQMTSELRRGE